MNKFVLSSKKPFQRVNQNTIQFQNQFPKHREASATLLSSKLVSRFRYNSTELKFLDSTPTPVNIQISNLSVPITTTTSNSRTVSQTKSSQITLQDLNSRYFKQKRVPTRASQTCQGNTLLANVVKPVVFEPRPPSRNTIQEFRMSKQDIKYASRENLHRLNHVQNNIQLASKINEQKNVLINFKQSILAKNNAENLLILKSKQDKMQSQKRKEMLKKVQRWEDFKKKRAKIIDRYLAQKRKCKASEQILRAVFLQQILQVLKNNYKEACYRYQLKVRGKFMYLVIANRWLRRFNKFGEKRKQYYIKSVFSFTVNSLKDNFELCSSQHVLKPFLLMGLGRDELVCKIRSFYSKLTYIQKKFKNQIATKTAKIEVLINYWNKLLGQIQVKATLINHEEGKQICKDIIQKTLPKIQYAVLKKYVIRCKELHSIAFLQWLEMFWKKIDKDNLKDTIKTRITQFNFQKQLQPDPCKGVSKDFIKKFEMNQPQKEYLISSFQYINMNDPFCGRPPIIIQIDKLVYPDSRFLLDNSPSCIFIPQRMLMFKMMRACVGIEKECDLWFNKCDENECFEGQ